jgi:NitT/TauT family transport system ATP-binding protein
VRRLWRQRGITVLFVTHDIDEAVHLGETGTDCLRLPHRRTGQLKVELPDDRDQLRTRVAPRLAEPRTQVYEQIQAAKRGAPLGLRTDRPPPH